MESGVEWRGCVTGQEDAQLGLGMLAQSRGLPLESLAALFEDF